MIARRIRIAGKVQGVFFRDWTVATARSIGVNGWVRNRHDQSVEALAIGETVAVEAFIAKLHEGSPASRVDRVEVGEADVEPMTDFCRQPTA